MMGPHDVSCNCMIGIALYQHKNKIKNSSSTILTHMAKTNQNHAIANELPFTSHECAGTTQKSFQHTIAMRQLLTSINYNSLETKF